ncbi:hypothetical protein MIND_00237000 [Mycena indigotica]|uniref:SHSP domain-containing protein n=1 Tax=Mycena indigotica TaxID=2126181 RepID=A0A8H6T7B4_9AGAR|nr:uncharacterized protein MIND_00237000 [Mycena indigotica]KAF7312240.1 hypothetical protein MIND_00237000 [Mycena indigotica]
MASPARLDMLSSSSRHQPGPSRLSPITPVTGIVYPSADETENVSQSSTRPQTLRRTSKLLPQPKKSIDAADDHVALDDLWSALRRQKELKMEKEKAKVRSLEDHRPTINGSGDTSSPSPQPTSSLKIRKTTQRTSPPPPPTAAPSLANERRWLIEDFSEKDSFFPNAPDPKTTTPSPPPPPPHVPTPPSSGLKKKKSILSFQVLKEKNSVVAIFDLKLMDKEAVRISHNLEQNEITVSWEVCEKETWTEDDCIVHQTMERLYYRVIELADGVESREIYAAMKNGDLLLRLLAHPYVFVESILTHLVVLIIIILDASLKLRPLFPIQVRITLRDVGRAEDAPYQHLVSYHHPSRVMSSSQPWDDAQATVEDPLVAVFPSPTRSRHALSPHSFNMPPDSPSASEHAPLIDRPQLKKKPFYRPRPLWLVPFACTSALVRGMTLAPRVEVFSQLSCSRLHHHFNHTESASLVPPHAQLYSSLDPLGPQFNPDPTELWVIVEPQPGEDKDRPWGDDETEDDPRRVPSARCMSDAAVQADAARLQTIFTTTMGLLSALTTGWWGRFGERHGRTMVLSFSVFGLLLTDLIFIISSTPSSPFSAHGHKLLLVAPVIEGALGGWSTLQSAISAYISDCTSNSSRAGVFSRFSGVQFIGIGVGPILGGWLIRHPIPWLTSLPHPGQPQVATVTSVFWVAVALQILNLLVVLLIVPESVHKDNGKGKARDISDGESTSDDTATKAPVSRGVFSDFFSPLAIFLPVPLLVDGTVRQRKDYSLTFLACALFAYMLSAGLYQIKYLYAGHVYGWGAEQLSYYISLLGSTRAIYLLFILPSIITALKPKPKVPKDKATKPKPTKAHLAREINFDLNLSRISLCIEIVALLAVACSPTPLYQVHSLYMNDVSADSKKSTFQHSQSLFVFASWLQCMGSGAVPAIQSLALCVLQARSLVSPDAAEVDARAGTLFGALAVLQASGQMVLGPLFFGLVYSGTVAACPKTVFVTAVAILFAALVALLLVRNPLSESRARSLSKISARRQRRISWEEEHRGRSRISKDLRGYGSTIQTAPQASSSKTASV